MDGIGGGLEGGVLAGFVESVSSFEESLCAGVGETGAFGEGACACAQWGIDEELVCGVGEEVCADVPSFDDGGCVEDGGEGGCEGVADGGELGPLGDGGFDGRGE